MFKTKYNSLNRLEDQTGKIYDEVMNLLQERYIRGLIDYFYAEWRYNHYLKRVVPVYGIFFSEKYFNTVKRYGYNHQSHIANGYGPLLEDQVIKGVLEKMEAVYKQDLLVNELPEVKHLHAKETINMVTNLFAEGKIKSFKLGTGVSEEHLTLEIVDNAANVSKWDIDKDIQLEINQELALTI